MRGTPRPFYAARNCAKWSQEEKQGHGGKFYSAQSVLPLQTDQTLPSEYRRRQYPYLILYPNQPAPPCSFTPHCLFCVLFLLLFLLPLACLILSNSPLFSNRWCLEPLSLPRFSTISKEREAEEQRSQVSYAHAITFNHTRPHGRRKVTRAYAVPQTGCVQLSSTIARRYRGTLKHLVSSC